jgi:hypothetical protein
MGAYFEWDGYQNYLIAARNGFTPYHTDVEGSLYGYENVDNLQTGIHDFLRFLKFGYGRAVDIASSHIRRGRLTRDEAIDLVRDRDGKFPITYLGVPIENALSELDMTRDDFYRVCDRFTNREVVAWASSSASYQHFCGTITAASKASNSIQAAA